MMQVAVICKNKKDGKQLAAAKLLQQLHPHINNWGSLLRMYGNRLVQLVLKFNMTAFNQVDQNIKEEEREGDRSHR